MKFCSKCNKQFNDEFTVCSFCGNKLLTEYKPECTWLNYKVNEDVKPKCDKKKEGSCNLSEILSKTLKLAELTMVNNKTWNAFGYEELPSYNSKFSVLLDIFNVPKKTFLISELMASGIGIGINLLKYNKLIKDNQIQKSVNYIMSCIASDVHLYRMLYLDEIDKRKRFTNNIYEYVNEYYMDDKDASSGTGFESGFFASLGPRHKFYKLFLSHMEKEDVYDVKFDKGIRNVVSFYFDNYDEPFKKIVVDYNIVDNL